MKKNYGSKDFTKLFQKEKVSFSDPKLQDAWNSVHATMEKIYFHLLRDGGNHRQYGFDQSNYRMEQSSQSDNLVNLSSYQKDFGKSFTVSSSFLHGDII